MATLRLRRPRPDGPSRTSEVRLAAAVDTKTQKDGPPVEVSLASLLRLPSRLRRPVRPHKAPIRFDSKCRMFLPSNMARPQFPLVATLGLARQMAMLKTLPKLVLVFLAVALGLRNAVPIAAALMDVRQTLAGDRLPFRLAPAAAPAARPHAKSGDTKEKIPRPQKGPAIAIRPFLPSPCPVPAAVRAARRDSVLI